LHLRSEENSPDGIDVGIMYGIWVPEKR